ncbi:caspase family protein [Rhodococcus sp. NPDC058521]|uniref:caspase family protein n=1 Tax=Rhodococcus sp. NPDC058521 TaxID=3346536 RepID=UPI0036649922
MNLLEPSDRPAADPSLVFEDRALAGKPALHALIAGVSEYSHLPGPGEAATSAGLGMRRLSCTSLTAYLILDWLMKTADEQRLHFPLGSVRLLLSPTTKEIGVTALHSAQGTIGLPPIAQLKVPTCDQNNLSAATEAWRRSATANRDGATFFYFSGHGIQRTRSDQLLLLDTFGAGGTLSRHSVDVSSLRNGMAPYANSKGLGDPSGVRPEIARTQFYFIDACRSAPSRLLSYEELRSGAVWDVEAADMRDDRRAPVFYAAIPAGAARALTDKQSLFSMALLRCLAGEAANAPDQSTDGRSATDWHVSSFSLNLGLPRRLDEVNADYGGDQIGLADGFTEDAVLCYLKERPLVSFQLGIEPDNAAASTCVHLEGQSDPKYVRDFRTPADPYPFRVSLEAGFYEFSAALDQPRPPLHDCKAQLQLVEPLRPRVWKARMSDGR